MAARFIAASYATHGRTYNKANMLPVKTGDILLYAHTHIPECMEQNGVLVLNPGSVSISKAGSCHGYMTLESGLFLWKNLDGKN